MGADWARMVGESRVEEGPLLETEGEPRPVFVVDGELFPVLGTTASGLLAAGDGPLLLATEG